MLSKVFTKDFGEETLAAACMCGAVCSKFSLWRTLVNYASEKQDCRHKKYNNNCFTGCLMPGCVVVKPEIDIFPKSVTVSEGEEVVFKCVVSSIPEKEKEPVQWFRKKLGGLGSDPELKRKCKIDLR